MIDQWREWLYPLGFLASIAFSCRMLLQWVSSEIKGQSIVTRAFWRLSLCGNLLLALHSLVQIQFHVCLVQVCNGVISWRNLDLMQPAERQFSLRRTIEILIIAIVSLLTLFWLNGVFLSDSQAWFRIPSAPWQTHANLQISFSWHLLGFLGLTLFSSRFWVQWWKAEQKKISHLDSSFWLISLMGEGLCLAYFLKIHDPVNAIGPAFGLIPYIRNLMLIYKKKVSRSTTNG